MIQCRLRELIGAKARQERRRITYDDIQAQTGVNKNTLTRLANDRAGMVGLSVVDRLCAYFDCQPGDPQHDDQHRGHETRVVTGRRVLMDGML